MSYKSIEYSEFVDNLDIKVNISLKNKGLSLWKVDKSLFGYIEVKSIHSDVKESCFWDNLAFFLESSKSKIKDSVYEELVQKNLYHKDVVKTIKKLLKNFKKDFNYGKK